MIPEGDEYESRSQTERSLEAVSERLTNTATELQKLVDEIRHVLKESGSPKPDRKPR